MDGWQSTELSKKYDFGSEAGIVVTGTSANVFGSGFSP